MPRIGVNRGNGCRVQIRGGSVTNVFNSSLKYRRRLRRTLGMSFLAAAILSLSSHSSSNAAEGPWPGLPRFTGEGSWTGAAQGGISQAAKARQWAQVPMQVTAARQQTTGTEYPQPDPLDRFSRRVYTISLFLVSPPGSEHNYGMSPKFTVRTVAFGAIPVEATLQLIQRRGPDGLPVPIVASSGITFFNVSGTAEYEDTVIEDDVTLRVTRLVVDGVDLGLAGRCQTAEPGKLSLFGRGWNETEGVSRDYPWLQGRYFASAGGALEGSVDIPSFAGCTSSNGEDISRLLASAVSGPGNAVKLHVSGPVCTPNLAPSPGTTRPDQPGPNPALPVCPAEKVPPQVPIP